MLIHNSIFLLICFNVVNSLENNVQYQISKTSSTSFFIYEAKFANSFKMCLMLTIENKYSHFQYIDNSGVCNLGISDKIGGQTGGQSEIIVYEIKLPAPDLQSVNNISKIMGGIVRIMYPIL